MNQQRATLFPEGRLSLGANYWASHAGTAMWSDWREQVVREDLRKLAAAGMDVLRVFPLWPDFQPIHRLFKQNNVPVGFSFADGVPLPNRDGIDEVMVERFRALCRIAAECEIKLVVGLVTGWMSGRLFVPPGLVGLDPITDTISVRWQVRLARGLVERLIDEPGIAAWDLGNECNEMGAARSRDEAYAWTAAVAGAIRSADPGRPLVSGMHSLKVAEPDVWRIQDQGELTDVLTTHPYPFWVPHVGNNPTDTAGPILHAAAETTLYADLSGKPAFAEEIGSMGPTVLDDDRSADFFRASTFTLWAHGGRASLWWCAFDQEALVHPPYEWVAVERRLGMVRRDGSSKPVLDALGQVRIKVDDILTRHGIDALPPRVVDAAVLLTPGQDNWAAAFGAFVLAKQSGLDVRFMHAGAALPEGPEVLPDPVEVPALIVPSVAGLMAITASLAAKLHAYVEAGGRLLVTLDDAHVPDLDTLFGLHLHRRYPRTDAQPLASDVRLDLSVESAEVHAAEPDGNPVLTSNRVGRGEAWFLTWPAEKHLATTPDGIDAGLPFYQQFANGRQTQKRASCISLGVHMTEHILDASRRLLLLVNVTHAAVEAGIMPTDGWTSSASSVTVPPFGVADALLTAARASSA
ncbi:MAG: hypothetical protein AAGD32_10350 [Planctomycetota bacterium]